MWPQSELTAQNSPSGKCQAFTIIMKRAHRIVTIQVELRTLGYDPTPEVWYEVLPNDVAQGKITCEVIDF